MKTAGSLRGVMLPSCLVEKAHYLAGAASLAHGELDLTGVLYHLGGLHDLEASNAAVVAESTMRPGRTSSLSLMRLSRSVIIIESVSRS